MFAIITSGSITFHSASEMRKDQNTGSHNNDFRCRFVRSYIFDICAT